MLRDGARLCKLSILNVSKICHEKRPGCSSGPFHVLYSRLSSDEKELRRPDRQSGGFLLSSAPDPAPGSGLSLEVIPCVL